MKGVCQYPGDLLYLVWIKSFHRPSRPDRILGLKLMSSSLDNFLNGLILLCSSQI